VADPKAKDAPKRLNMEARFDVAPPEVQGPTESPGSTLYSDAGDKPPVAEGPAKPGAKVGAKSVSDLAYGAAEPPGALAARNALTRDNGGAEAVARILADHPMDRAAILREAEQLRGAGFAADVKRCEQKTAEKPQDDRPFTVAADPSQAAPEAKKDERGAEVQSGQATKQGAETTEPSAEGGVNQVQQVDTQMTE
jgi:hypothetical protein